MYPVKMKDVEGEKNVERMERMEKRHEWMFIEIMRTACSFLQMLVYY